MSLLKSRLAKAKEEQSSSKEDTKEDPKKMKSDSAKTDLQKMQSLRKILEDKEKPQKEGKENDVSEATRALLSRDKKKSLEKAAPPPPPSTKAPQKDEKSARKGISLASLIKDSDKDDKKNEKSKNLETPKDSKRSDRIRTAERRTEGGDRKKSLSPSNASDSGKRNESKFFYHAQKLESFWESNF